MTTNLSKHCLRREDYIFPRQRTDAAWTELRRTPPMESIIDQAVGVSLIGISAAAVLYVLFEIGLMVGHVSLVVQ